MRFRIVATALVAVCLFVGAAYAQQPKVIKDPNEYNAYITALKIADPAKKAAAMEDFAKKYPKSVVHQDALEQAMAAYQQAGNVPKVEATATRILALDHANIRALAVLTFLERSHATQGDAKALAAMRTHAAEGLRALPKWKKPEGISDAEFTKLKAQMAWIFNGAAGFAALQDKDYAKARGFYVAAVKLDPGDLQDVYQLGIAELQMSPPDADGFWYVARAKHIADTQKNLAGAQSIEKYGKAKYASYHGGEDGWDAIVTAAEKSSAPPAGFTVKAK